MVETQECALVREGRYVSSQKSLIYRINPRDKRHSWVMQAALSEGGSALAKQQRAAEERARRLTAAENRAAMLEAEKADLQQELEEHLSRCCSSSPTILLFTSTGYHGGSAASAQGENPGS